MSAFKVRLATTRADHDTCMSLIWRAHHYPYERWFNIFYPVFGGDASALEARIAESKERLWTTHQARPGISHWLLVEETATGEAVGCCEWEIHRQNPFKDGLPKIEAHWWPEGEGREYVQSWLGQCFGARMWWMHRPHLALNMMSVVPEYRRRGAGSLLMEWGDQKARELGVEVLIEGSELGRPLYEKFGFRTLLKMMIDPHKDKPGLQWQRLQHETGSYGFYIMWRPATGVFDEQTRLPWDLGRNDEVK